VRVVAVGRFDGVHVGHQALLERARCLADQLDIPLLAYTFPSGPPALLTTKAKERLLLRSADEVCVVKWEQVRSLSPEAFLRQELVGRLEARGLVMGQDHRFGHGARGTPELARSLAPELGLTVDVVPPMVHGGAPVSARRIRQLLRAGGVREAVALLGRPPLLWGSPIRGAGRARELGYPTINLQLQQELLQPAPGVYTAWMQYHGGTPALFYLGDRPTFPELPFSAELHLLKRPPSELRGMLEVHLLAYLREDQRFVDTASLKSQIARDVRAARQQLSASPPPEPVLVD